MTWRARGTRPLVGAMESRLRSGERLGVLDDLRSGMDCGAKWRAFRDAENYQYPGPMSVDFAKI